MRNYVLTVILCCGAAGCDRPVERRQHTEVFIETERPAASSADDPHAFLQAMPRDDIHANLDVQDMDLQMLEAPAAQNLLEWDVPGGWSERKSGGMRLATFVNTGEDDPIETSVISLGGEAGGLEANIIRWLQQIGLPSPGPEEMADFMGRQERLEVDGRTAVIVDLTLWQDQLPPQAPSIIAAVVEDAESKIFIKMTGSKKAVRHNQPRLKALVRSLRFNE
jgi:hypothetical protein